MAMTRNINEISVKKEIIGLIQEVVDLLEVYNKPPISEREQARLRPIIEQLLANIAIKVPLVEGPLDLYANGIVRNVAEESRILNGILSAFLKDTAQEIQEAY